MSTGPGPTRKADGTKDDHVEELSELLVDAESQKINLIPPKAIDDGLDISMETPGPASLSGFMPPPPGPSLGAEDSDAGLDANPSSNLAYEDLLAKLVLPSKTPGVVHSETPPPSPFIAPPTPGIFGPSNLGAAASSSDERTLVTQNPLLAEEQETAAREGLASPREELPQAFPLAMGASPIAPVAPVTFQPSAPIVVAPNKPVAIYLMLGSALVILASILVILVVKFVLPGSPSPTPRLEQVVVPPSPAPSVALPPTPPSQVVPLPPSEAPAAKEPDPEPKPEPAAEAPSEQPEPEAAVAPKEPAKPRKSVSSSSHSKKESKAKDSKPKESRAKESKQVASPKPKASKSSKSGAGWADPFAN